MRKEIFNMTQREITKLRVINQTIDKVLLVKEAAELLNLSERQVIRLKKGVALEGPAFIIHKNRGRKPGHAILDKTKDSIVKLKQGKYLEANFSHFRDLLEEHEGISVSYPTVYRILTSEGIKSPKKHKRKKTYHRRKRKPQKGMLVQIDASPHKWFIGGGEFTLHGAIDDATGDILALFYTKNECMDGYFEIIRQIITYYGIPTSLYCDRHTIFVSPKDGKLTIKEQLEGVEVNLTQFGRAMDELGINIIKAKSPQAKGRIEKLWDTLQSRLPIEFKIRGITTLEAANYFLLQFMKSYNKKFAVEPENPISAFRELDPNIILDNVLCKKDKRQVIEGSVFSYKGKYYQLIKNGKKTPTIPKAKITVLDSSRFGIKAEYSGIVYETIMIEQRPKKASLSRSKAKSEGRPKRNVKPSENHPWRNVSKKAPISYYTEPDGEILKMLDELFSSKRAWI
jgi:transposase